MKLLTLNFLTCAIKTCKPHPAAFPLHIRDAELESVELDFNPLFLRNVMSRIEWGAMRTVLGEVGLKLPAGLGDEASGEGEAGLQGAEVGQGMEVDPAAAAGGDEGMKERGEEEARKEEVQEEVSEDTLRRLHETLMETQVVSGKLVCGNCGHEYQVKEGIPNFLLPAHLV